MTVNGGTSPYTFSSTTLPAGLSINPNTGAITGRPTTAGAHTATISATDSLGHTATKTVTWTVLAAQASAPVMQAAAVSTVTPEGLLSPATRGVTVLGATPT